MPAGPGKYDYLATYCREQTNADVVVVMIRGGSGSGFSVQTREPIHPHMLAAILRDIAAEIERSVPLC